MIKSITNALSLIVAVAALTVSIRTCTISDQAQKTAQDALNSSRKQFVEENRPYVSIKSVEFKKTKSFFMISKEDDKRVLKLQYQIKNIGSVAARNIVLESITVPSDIFESANSTSFAPPPIVTLFPGEEIYMEIKAVSKSIPSFTLDNLKAIEVQIAMTYIHDLSNSIKYLTKVKHSIESNNVILTASSTSSNAAH